MAPLSLSTATSAWVRDAKGQDGPKINPVYHIPAFVNEETTKSAGEVSINRVQLSNLRSLRNDDVLDLLSFIQWCFL